MRFNIFLATVRPPDKDSQLFAYMLQSLCLWPSSPPRVEVDCPALRCVVMASFAFRLLFCLAFAAKALALPSASAVDAKKIRNSCVCRAPCPFGASVGPAQAFSHPANASSCTGGRERYHARGLRSALAQRFCFRCDRVARGFLLRCMQKVRSQLLKAIGAMVRKSSTAQRRQMLSNCSAPLMRYRLERMAK